MLFQVFGPNPEEKNLSSKKWLEDKDVVYCLKCKTLFTITNRRHHCRDCGKIFCESCSSKTLPLEQDAGKKYRVCDNCYASRTAAEFTQYPDENTNLIKKIKKTERYNKVHKYDGAKSGDLLNLIDQDPKWLGGRPRICDTRFSVLFILSEFLSIGYDKFIQKYEDSFPSCSSEDSIDACLLRVARDSDIYKKL